MSINLLDKTRELGLADSLTRPFPWQCHIGHVTLQNPFLPHFFLPVRLNAHFLTASETGATVVVENAALWAAATALGATVLNAPANILRQLCDGAAAARGMEEIGAGPSGGGFVECFLFKGWLIG